MARKLGVLYPWTDLLEYGFLDDGREYKIVVQYGSGCFRLVAFDSGLSDWVYVSNKREAHWWLLGANERTALVASFLKRANDDSKARVAASVDRDGAFRARYPALSEWLSADSYPEGGARETSTLLFFVEGGGWKGCLNDRDQKRGLWASGGALEEVLTALEDHLQAGTGEWRQSGPRGTKGRSK